MEPQTLETLSPEIQAQIMRNVNSLSALLAIIRASPRFYQVFRDRREYILTQVAFNPFHPLIINDVWGLAKALQLDKPLEDHVQVQKFLNERKNGDNDFLRPSVSLDITIPLCKMGETMAWFLRDYHSSALGLLSYVSTDMDLQSDPEALHSNFSATELGRLQRAFCRFETYCCLIGRSDIEQPEEYSRRYLLDLMADECEEIACIRDYLIRRLVGVFEDVEDEAMHGENSDSIRQLGQAHKPRDWFSGSIRPYHEDYLESAMVQGLNSLRTLFESHGFERAQLVMSIPRVRRKLHLLTGALGNPNLPVHLQSVDYDDGKFDGEDVFEGDEVDNLSQGLLWANKSKVPADYFRRPLKGLRDWGYVFWDRSRLHASGILDIEPEDVAVYSFNDDMNNRKTVESRLGKCPLGCDPEGWGEQAPLAFGMRPEGRRRSPLDTSCAIGNGERF
ncbi:MAG: hypothetical protein Q9168_006983 [Polycauliona sp. 1 TL-2023]